MLVTEAIGRPVDTCAGPTVAQATKPMTDKDHGAWSVTLQESLIGIIEREIMRSVGLGNSPEPTTGGIESAAGARSRNAHQA
jgi:hypothetical protein